MRGQKYRLTRCEAASFIVRSSQANVDCSELCAVLGIGLGVKSNLLTLGQGLKALNLNGGEVYEYIVATLVIGNKAVALLSVEPLNCTFVHVGYLRIDFVPGKNKKPTINANL